MAVTPITPIPLVLNVASADLPDAGGTVATTPADGWVIAMGAGDLGGKTPPEALILKFVADASGDTVTIKEGVDPPAKEAPYGDLAITLAALDVKYIVVSGGRFTQADGTLKAVCTDAGTMCTVFAMPRQSGRGGG